MIRGGSGHDHGAGGLRLRCEGAPGWTAASSPTTLRIFEARGFPLLDAKGGASLGDVIGAAPELQWLDLTPGKGGNGGKEGQKTGSRQLASGSASGGRPAPIVVPTGRSLGPVAMCEVPVLPRRDWDALWASDKTTAMAISPGHTPGMDGAGDTPVGPNEHATVTLCSTIAAQCPKLLYCSLGQDAADPACMLSPGDVATLVEGCPMMEYFGARLRGEGDWDEVVPILRRLAYLRVVQVDWAPQNQSQADPEMALEPLSKRPTDVR